MRSLVVRTTTRTMTFPARSPRRSTGALAAFLRTATLTRLPLTYTRAERSRRPPGASRWMRKLRRLTQRCGDGSPRSEANTGGEAEGSAAAFGVPGAADADPPGCDPGVAAGGTAKRYQRSGTASLIALWPAGLGWMPSLKYAGSYSSCTTAPRSTASQSTTSSHSPLLRIHALSLRRSLPEIVAGADCAAGGHVGQ